MTTATACPHLSQQLQLETIYVLDSHIHMTDGFVECVHCGAHYLVELADLVADRSLFRISAIDPDAVAKTSTSLRKGSCDIERGRNEVFSLASGAAELPVLLVMKNGAFTSLLSRPAGVNLPRRSWRELPCDGNVIRLCTNRHPC